MAKSRNYVPRRDAEFNRFFEGIVNYVQKKAVKERAWTDIPEVDLRELAGAWEDWAKSYGATLVPHLPSVTAMKNIARERNEKALRKFIQRFLYWRPVGDGDRTNMGLPLRDTVRTAHPHVAEEVELELRLSRISAIELHFRIKGAGHRAKPKAYGGALIVWDVLDEPPPNPKDLKRHVLAGRTPHTLEFPWDERGKTVYIAAAWQNDRGVTGPFTDMERAYIP